MRTALEDHGSVRARQDKVLMKVRVFLAQCPERFTARHLKGHVKLWPQRLFQHHETSALLRARTAHEVHHLFLDNENRVMKK